MNINYTFFKILVLTGLMSPLFFQARAAELRRSSITTEHAFTANQNEEKIETEEAGNKTDEPEIKKNQSEALDNNIFYADEWIKSWFIRLDQNGDKLVSKEEFKQNMKPFSLEGKHLTVFESEEINADGVLNLGEFQKFIDSTNFLSKSEIAQKEATITEEANDVDTIKLMAGVLAISLLMAAFKFV